MSVRKLLASGYFYAFLVTAMIIFLGIVYRSHIWSFFNPTTINKMQINTNLKFTSNENIKQAINVSANKDKGYFDFNTKQLIQTLEGYTWIDFVLVSKVWPDTVNIRIQELQPYAIWTNGLQVGYITEQGKLFFSPQQQEQNLQIEQQLNTNKSSEKLQFDKSVKLNIDQVQSNIPIFVSNQYYIATAIHYWEEIKSEMNNSNLKIKEIRVDSSDAWQIMLSNNILLNLDATDIKASIRRFLLAAQQIKVPDGYLISYVDLRYNNGIAVKFISEQEAKQDKKHITSLVPGKGGNPLPNAQFISTPIKGKTDLDFE